MFVSRLRFGLSTAFSLCLLTSACAAPAPTAPSVAPDVRRVQLSFLTWNYTGTMKAAYDEYITSFLAKEPRVTAVEAQAQPFVNFAAVLNVRLSPKTPRNISWLSASTSPLYVSAAKLVGLTPV